MSTRPHPQPSSTTTELAQAWGKGVRSQLPALTTALDGDLMAAHLEETLLDASKGGRVVRCEPGNVRYTPGAGCDLRYRIDVRDGDGHVTAIPVNATVFANAGAAETHLRTRLAPLARQAHGRSELAAFNQPVACLQQLGMTVSAFPIDARLPTLLWATDPRRVAPLLESGGLSGDIRVTLTRYGTGRRCILGYEARRPSQGRRVVVGKVDGDGCGEAARRAITALRGNRSFDVPRLVGYDRALNLLVVEAIPAGPVYARQIKHHLRSGPDDGAARRAVEACAQIAAELHCSGAQLAPPRTPDRQMRALAATLHAMAPFAPGLHSVLLQHLGHAGELLESSEAMPMRACHGDYKPNQILVGTTQATLIDLDTACMAEPPLDLGHFLAYLRLTATDTRSVTAAGDLVDELALAFMDTYAVMADPAPQLRSRTLGYELLSLIRGAAHSWQKLKVQRIAAALALIEERLSCNLP
jgi:hypothetical protein